MAFGKGNLGGGDYFVNDIVNYENVKINGELAHDLLVANITIKNSKVSPGAKESKVIITGVCNQLSTTLYLKSYDLNLNLISESTLIVPSVNFSLIEGIIDNEYVYFYRAHTIYRIKTSDISNITISEPTTATGVTRGMIVIGGLVYLLINDSSSAKSYYRRFGTSANSTLNATSTVITSTYDSDGGYIVMASGGKYHLKRLSGITTEVYSVVLSYLVDVDVYGRIITSSANYIYIYDGTAIFKHDKSTGTHISTIALAGVVTICSVNNNLIVFTESALRIYNASDEIIFDKILSFKVAYATMTSDKSFMITTSTGEKYLLTEAYKHVQSVTIMK